MADIFISYASEDREEILPLVEVLNAQGYSVWWDREIDPGANFENVIEAQLAAAKVVVTIWSPNSVHSSWVHSEAMEGLERGVLVPVLLERTRLPLAFRHINTADLSGWGGDPDSAEFRRFAVALQKVKAGEVFTTDTTPSLSIRHETRPTQKYFIAGLAVAAALVLALGVWTQWPGSNTPGRAATPEDSIAVLDFENPGSAETAYIATGMSDQIRDLLTRTRAVQVASRTLSASSLGSDITRSARYFLEGSALAGPQTLQIDVHLVDGENGFRVWSRRFNVQLSQVLDASVDIVQAVIKEMKLPNQNNAVLADVYRPTLNATAFNDYLIGADLLKEPTTDEIITRAEAAFNSAIEHDPGFAMPYAGLCRTHLTRYRHSRDTTWYQSARDYCERALSLDANQPHAYSALGSLYLTAGNYAAATDAFEAALNLSPSDPEIVIGMANSLSKSGELGRAEKWFRRAISLDQQYWHSHAELGSFLFNSGTYDEAIVAYREVVRLHPEYGPGWTGLSAAYQLNGDLQDAVSTAEIALKFNRSAHALSNAATALYFTGRFEEARAMYLEAIEMSAGNHLIWGNLGETELVLGNTRSSSAAFDKAIELARSNLQVNPTNAETLGRLASYLALRLDNADEVLTLLRLAHELQNDDPYLHYDAALAHLRLGDITAARQNMETAIALGYPKILADADPQLHLITGLPAP